jgi:hypothetical protein
MLLLLASNKQALRTQPLRNRRDLEEPRPDTTIFVPKFMGVFLGDVLACRVPVSASWRHRVSLQRKICCQQIIGLNDESFSVAVWHRRKKGARAW